MTLFDIKKWGLALAALCVALSLWACVLLAQMVRPVVLVPKDSPPMFAACRLDSTGTPRLVWLMVRVDR